MNNKRCGISVFGSALVDKINEIDAYPKCGELTQIKKTHLAVGGCVPNVAIDIKKMMPSLPVYAGGSLGNDKEGDYIRHSLERLDIDTSGFVISEKDKTSFTEVMSVINGQRTFFTYAGACADFGACDIDFTKISSKILHLGYFLLLDKIDRGDGLKILKKATEYGIKTSIDLVSENSDRYSTVIPCLPYTDYIIINEKEAAKISGMNEWEPLDKIAEKIMEYGVREKVIIHKPEYQVIKSRKKEAVFLPSYDLPANYIKGTTGAGDAFCAGALIAIHQNLSDSEILEFASSAAVMSLSEADATSGLKSEKEIKEICKNFDRKKLCL